MSDLELRGNIFSTTTYAEVDPLYLGAIEIEEKAPGPQHPGLATTLNNRVHAVGVAGTVSGRRGQSRVIQPRSKRRAPPSATSRVLAGKYFPWTYSMGKMKTLGMMKTSSMGVNNPRGFTPDRATGGCCSCVAVTQHGICPHGYYCALRRFRAPANIYYI